MNSGNENLGDRIWRLTPAVRLDRRVWDDEVVVFNHASGQTHLLDALSNTVLARFENRPWPIGDLAQSLASEFAVAPAEVIDRLKTIVDEFAQTD